eukprot:COSAG05_NODE_7769_length_772_cov_0.839525_1_plen_139_part_00
MTQAMILQAKAMREEKEAKERKKREKEEARLVDESNYAGVVDQANRNLELGGDDLNASGIDGALGAVGGDKARIQAMAVQGSLRDQNQAAKGKMTYKVFEGQRIPELKEEKPGLKGSQYRDLCKKDWQRSPMNPKNAD